MDIDSRQVDQCRDQQDTTNTDASYQCAHDYGYRYKYKQRTKWYFRKYCCGNKQIYLPKLRVFVTRCTTI